MTWVGMSYTNFCFVFTFYFFVIFQSGKSVLKLKIEHCSTATVQKTWWRFYSRCLNYCKCTVDQL